MPEDGATAPTVVPDWADIEAILPHRGQMLLVNEVLELQGTTADIVAEAAIPENPFWREGHFPGNPVMPGVLILEMMAQAAGLLCALTLGRDTTGRGLLVEADKVRFREEVRPGDVLQIRVSYLGHPRAGFWFFTASAWKKGNSGEPSLVAEVQKLTLWVEEQPAR